MGVGEEVGMGNGIVFEDNAALNLREEPCESVGGSGTAAKIMRGVPCVEPCRRSCRKLVDDLSHLSQTRRVIGVVWTGTVLEDV